MTTINTETFTTELYQVLSVNKNGSDFVRKCRGFLKFRPVGARTDASGRTVDFGEEDALHTFFEVLISSLTEKEYDEVELEGIVYRSWLDYNHNLELVDDKGIKYSDVAARCKKKMRKISNLNLKIEMAPELGEDVSINTQIKTCAKYLEKHKFVSPHVSAYTELADRGAEIGEDFPAEVLTKLAIEKTLEKSTDFEKYCIYLKLYGFSTSEIVKAIQETGLAHSKSLEQKVRRVIKNFKNSIWDFNKKAPKIFGGKELTKPENATILIPWKTTISTITSTNTHFSLKKKNSDFTQKLDSTSRQDASNGPPAPFKVGTVSSNYEARRFPPTEFALPTTSDQFRPECSFATAATTENAFDPSTFFWEHTRTTCATKQTKGALPQVLTTAILNPKNTLRANQPSEETLKPFAVDKGGSLRILMRSSPEKSPALTNSTSTFRKK